jgi:DNA-binding MarR family transcriptional regulator
MSRLRTANLLGALVGEVAERLDRQLKSHPNQTDTSAAALALLSYYEGLSNADLARALGLSHPATVRLADKLEAAGLVETRAGRDRRAVAFHLTDAGRARARDILTARCAAIAEVIDPLSAAEQEQLAGLLERMLRAATKSMDNAVHICRLCDEIVCPEGACPVHQAALAHTEAAP